MKKKITAVALVVALLAVGIIGGTLAYFTDNETAVNTFTSGKVAITLTETFNTDTNQDQVNDAWTAKLIPGSTIDKDPVITVDQGSEDCWLVATVTISNRAELYELYDNTDVDKGTWLSLAGAGGLVSGGVADYTAAQATWNGMNGTNLTKTGESTPSVFLSYSEDVTADTITYTFWFLQAHAAGTSETLFTKVNVPTFLENGQLADLTVTVKAYAVQKANLDDAYAAYNAAF